MVHIEITLSGWDDDAKYVLYSEVKRLLTNEGYRVYLKEGGKTQQYTLVVELDYREIARKILGNIIDSNPHSKRRFAGPLPPCLTGLGGSVFSKEVLKFK